MPDNTENTGVLTDDETAVPTEDEPDADALILAMLKADLNRTGNFPSDNDYLRSLIAAAREWLEREGVRDDGGAMYRQILSSRAAWIYRKRVTGEAEPNFLRRMVADWKIAHVGTGAV